MSQDRPRIAIFGAGAIGLYLACRISEAGLPTTLVMRTGASLLQSISVEEGDQLQHFRHFIARPAHQPQPHDFVIVTTKAQDLPAAWPLILPWLGDTGQLVIAQNGLPWWFLDRLEKGAVLHAADPDGHLLHDIDRDRTIACVIHKSVDRLEPDHLRVLNASGDRFIFGRPFGDADAATKRLAAVFEACGIRADTATDIVIPLWEKLLGNVVLNPLSALTGGTAGSLLASPAHFATLKSGMEEARAVARAWGLPPGSTPTERLARTARVAASGPLRTSMLQDREAGRPLEIEPILGTVRELARRRNVPTPTLDRLYAEAIRLAISSLPRKPPCLQKSS